MTLFSHVLEAMIENNAINGARFSDWDHARHALDTYQDSYTGEEPEQDEMNATIVALDKIISSNGELLDEAVNEHNRAVWGAEFANNSGPTPFRG